MTIRCGSCGSENSSDNKFCESCGIALVAAKAAKSPKTKPAAIPAPASVEAGIPAGDSGGFAGISWENLYWWVVWVVAFAIRFYDIGNKPLHHDESIHAVSSYTLFTGGEYRYNPGYHGPVFYYLMAASYFLFGDSDATARFPFAFLGVAMVVLARYFQRPLGKVGSRALGLLLAVSPTIVYQSRFAREDIPTAAFDFLMVWGAMEWAATKKSSYLYASALGFSLAFSTKEATYINMFILVSFLALGWAWDLASSPLPLGELKASARSLAGNLRTFWMPGAVAGALFCGVMSLGKQGFPLASQAGTLLLLYTLAVGLIGMAASREEYQGKLGGLFTAFVVITAWAAAYYYQDSFSYQGMAFFHLPGPAAKVLLFVYNAAGLSAMVLGVALYTGSLSISLSSWSLYVMVPFTFFYTSVYRNPAGFSDGFYDSLIYWLEQHNVARGSQPWWYYCFLIPAYELLTMAGCAAALLILVKRMAVGGTGVVTLRMFAFLLYWAFFALVIYSIAGEKMPWIVIAITLPMIMATAAVAESLVAYVRAGGGRLMPTLAGSLGLAIAVLLGGLYLRHSVGLSHRRPADPFEPMVYVQSGYDVIEVASIIREISYRETGGEDLHMTIESTCSWPFSWYLRHFANKGHPDWIGPDENNPVVMTGIDYDQRDGKSRKDYNHSVLEPNYVSRQFNMRVWWLPHKHPKPGQEGVAASLPDLSYWMSHLGDLWDFMIYRKAWEPPPRWSDTAMMELWIRKDVWARYQGTMASYWRDKRYR